MKTRHFVPQMQSGAMCLPSPSSLRGLSQTHPLLAISLLRAKLFSFQIISNNKDRDGKEGLILSYLIIRGKEIDRRWAGLASSCPWTFLTKEKLVHLAHDLSWGYKRNWRGSKEIEENTQFLAQLYGSFYNETMGSILSFFYDGGIWILLRPPRSLINFRIKSGGDLWDLVYFSLLSGIMLPLPFLKWILYLPLVSLKWETYPSGFFVCFGLRVYGVYKVGKKRCKKLWL